MITTNRSLLFSLFGTILMVLACSPRQSQVMGDQQAAKEKMDEAAPPSTAEADPAPPEVKDPMLAPIPTDERLTQGKLSNGIHYYIQKNVKPENRAELRLAVNAGSILEDEDQLGLAHFVEHMAFNGTEHFEKSELVDYLESIGTRFGPDLNAYTSFDETVYMLQVRTDSTELFDKGMLIIRDWANGVTFDPEEIDKERGVVESEWRSRLSPDQRMQQVYFPIMYQGSQYAERLPIGDPDIINNADYETVKRYYKDWYRPDLMAVVVVGDVDVDQVEAQIKTLFGDIPAHDNPRPRTKFDVPHHPETLVSVVSDKEASFTNVQIMYKHDKIHTRNKGEYRQALVRNLYNTMLGARLSEISKEPDPPFLFAYTGYSGDVGDLDTYSSFAFVPEGKSTAALETLLTENKRVLLHGFTPGEMDRAKKVMMEGAERNLKEMDKTESGRLVMRYVYKYLDDNATPSPQQTLDLYTAFLPTIQLDEVNALPSQWIRDESRVVVITGPQKEEAPLPEEAEVRNMLNVVANAEVDPYEDDVVEQPFFDKELTAMPITSQEEYENVGIKYMKLSNGVEVYMKQTDFKNDEILMSATSPGGSSLYSDEEYFNASNSASIVGEAGIGAFSPTQLQKLLAGKTVSVRPYVGTLSEGMNGSASPDDLEIMFQMIYKYFYEPRIDEEAFASFVNKQSGLYKNLMSNPQYFFSDYVSKKKYNNHPRVGFPSAEDWENLDYARAMEIYKERFGDASDFIFTFVGNFDEAVLTDLAQKYLGNLPDMGRDETWQDVGIDAVDGGIKDRFEKGEAPKTNVHMYFHGDYEYESDNNYVMSSMLAYLRIKLREALREDLGGVYGVRVSGGGSKKPRQQYGITISFNADPPMADTLINAAKSVIQQALDEGPGDLDMTKVKETQKQGRIKDLKENRFWQRSIGREHEDEKDFDGILLEALEAKIAGLTAAQIKAAVGQYFDYSNYIEIVMDPEPQESN